MKIFTVAVINNEHECDCSLYYFVTPNCKFVTLKLQVNVILDMQMT